MAESASMPLIYTAQSKHMFYCRDTVCNYVLDRNAIPLHPFRLFEYFLGDRVDRAVIRHANYNLLRRCDEVWTFGDYIADGVLLEMAQALDLSLPLKHFTISDTVDNIKQISLGSLRLESEVLVKDGSKMGLTDLLRSGEARRVVSAIGRQAEMRGQF